jgi:hypothetical protein
MMLNYDQQILDYSASLGAYRDGLAAYSQWCDEDAKGAAFLRQNVQLGFASELLGLITVSMIVSPSSALLAL